jgi:transcriptional regulator with XRE-family HTH domain
VAGTRWPKQLLQLIFCNDLLNTRLRRNIMGDQTEWYYAEIHGQEATIEIQGEDLAQEVTEEINRIMTRNGVNRTELARRMRVSKPYVCKLLSGTANVSLRTLAKISAALDHKFRVVMVPEGWESRIFAVSPRNEEILRHRRKQYEGFREREEQAVLDAQGY